MRKRCISGFIVAALVLAGLFLLPQTSDGQFRNGRGFGFRGSRSSGLGSYGGYGYSPYQSGYGGYGGSGGYGYGSPYLGAYRAYGYGYGYGYPSSGYSSYGYSMPRYGYSAPYVNSYPTPAYASGQVTQSSQSFYPPDSSAQANTVHVLVNVPSPDATVWVEGAQTSQTGTTREFESPELSHGRDYTYHIRARWLDNGQTRDQTRSVRVHAGQWLTVDFNAPDNAGKTGPGQAENLNQLPTPAVNPGRSPIKPAANRPLDERPMNPPQAPNPGVNRPADRQINPADGVEVGPTGRIRNRTPDNPK